MTLKRNKLSSIILVAFICIGATKTNTYQGVPPSFKTPKGRQIKFKTNNNWFYVQWNRSNKLQTLDYEFQVNGADAWMPKFIDENQNYIFLRAGCGNPCWIGLFLPLGQDGEPVVIHEYLAYDLDTQYVAYINYDNDNLEVLNIKTGLKQLFTTDKCESAFKGYCVDSMYFKDNYLYYNWNAETYINSNKKGQTMQLVVEI